MPEIKEADISNVEIRPMLRKRLPPIVSNFRKTSLYVTQNADQDITNVMMLNLIWE